MCIVQEWTTQNKALCKFLMYISSFVVFFQSLTFQFILSHSILTEAAFSQKLCFCCGDFLGESLCQIDSWVNT